MVGDGPQHGCTDQNQGIGNAHGHGPEQRAHTFREARRSSHHHPYKVGIEDRREHDSGIAGVCKVVHRPGEQLTAGGDRGHQEVSCSPSPGGKGNRGTGLEFRRQIRLVAVFEHLGSGRIP